MLTQAASLDSTRLDAMASPAARCGVKVRFRRGAAQHGAAQLAAGWQRRPMNAGRVKMYARCRAGSTNGRQEGRVRACHRVDPGSLCPLPVTVLSSPSCWQCPHPMLAGHRHNGAPSWCRRRHLLHPPPFPLAPHGSLTPSAPPASLTAALPHLTDFLAGHCHVDHHCRSVVLRAGVGAGGPRR